MSMFDDTTGEVSNVGYGADATSTLASQPGIFESVGNMVTKGVPLTVLSIANSFINTPIEVANFFGADITPLKEENELRGMGWDNLADYYAAHEQGIEAVGLAAGSLIPGLAAVKAVKVLQAGRTTGILARATNLGLTPTQTVLDSALQSIESEGSLFNGLNSQRVRAISLGFRDQLMQNMAYEAATLAAMHGSPIINGDSLQNILTDSAYGLAFGVGIGGVIDGFSTWGKFRRALVNAETSTQINALISDPGFRKGAQIDGTDIAGDQSFKILASVNDLRDQTPTGLLANFRRNAAINKGELKFKQTILDAFGGGDESNRDIAGSFADMILRGVRDGKMTNDQLAQTLGGLATVGRIGEETVVPTTDMFYINTFSKNTVDGRIPTMDDLYTVALNDKALSARRYMRTPFSNKINVGSFLDTYVDPVTGEQLPLYASTKEAFAANMDIYVNNKNAIVVNPKAPNIEQVPIEGTDRIMSLKEYAQWKATGTLPPGSRVLTGDSRVVNLQTGAIKTDAVAVPGDLGGVQVSRDGIRFGTGDKSEFLPQAADTPFDATVTPLEAGARYIWADKIGIQRLTNHSIPDSDVPMLQAIYTNGVKQDNWQSWVTALEDKGITLQDGEAIPMSKEGMLDKIMIAKNQLIKDATQGNPQLSSEAIGRIANVKEDYISNVFTAMHPDDVIVPVDSLAVPNHAQVNYYVGNITRDSQGNINRGIVDVERRIGLLKMAAQDVVAKHLGENWKDFLAANYTSSDATYTGAGPGALTFSNAEYGTLAQRVEQIGAQVRTLITKWNEGDMNILMDHFKAIRDSKDAAAELSMFTFARRSTPLNYSFLPSELAARYFPDVASDSGIAVLEKSLVRDKSGAIIDWNKGFMPDGFLPGLAKDQYVDQITASQQGLRNFYQLSPEVRDFELAHMQLNDKRNMMKNDWYAGNGLSKTMPTGILYAPPIDAGKYPYVALIRPIPGRAFSDDSVSVITAESASALQQKINSINQNEFQVILKDDIKLFRQVQGDYEYQRNFNTGLTNSELQRKGVLNDFTPDVNIQSILQGVQDFHARQNARMIRDLVELGNGQLIAELRDMGERFSGVATSNVNWYSALEAKTAQNPYNSYIKTMLNLKSEPYKFWTDANEKLEAFADTAFRYARSAFISAQKGIISYEQASEMAERMGLGNPWAKMVDGLRSYQNSADYLPPGRMLSKLVSVINGVQSATALRLDTFNSLINIMSAPISILTEAASVRKLAQVTLPDGSGRVIPSNFKLLWDAAQDWWNPDIRNEWFPILQRLGALRKDLQDYYSMQNELSLPWGRGIQDSVVLNKIRNATEFASKFTGSDLAENYSRFVAAMVGRRAFEAQGVTGSDLIDNVMTFVNRVHGNTIASQRPIMFQGPIGHAATLFQTYQLNLLQQLTRYVTNGEGKTLAIYAGLQSGMFGIQGLPGFQMLNQYLVGNLASNPQHKDLYSTVTNYADKGLGDWLLYGSLSNLLNTGLYSRGDINPRNMSIIPLDPRQFPAISGAIQFTSDLLNTTDRLLKGGAVTATLLQGLEHNGLSRPLAGLAQLMNGYTTTSGGQLQTNIRQATDGTLGWSDIFQMGSFGRLAGARPLEEAIALDANYRRTMYEANDSAKLKVLSAAARTYFTAGQSMPPEVMQDFLTRYTQAGGRAENFGREVVSWVRTARTSITNDAFYHLQSPINRQMIMQMGGQPLPDYNTRPNIGSANYQLPTDTSEISLIP